MRQYPIEGRLPIMIFREGKSFVSYAPNLDLSSCGDTQEEAKRNLGDAIAILIEECLKDGTLEDVLRSCGWREKRKPSRQWLPPEFEFSQIPIATHGKK